MSGPGTDDDRANDQLASDFFAAIERADIDALEQLYSPEVRVWINVTGQVQGREDSLRLIRALTRRVRELRYDVASREFFPGGLVQRHVLRGELASGEKLAVPVCLVIHAQDGRIDELFEYLDAEAIAPVFAEPSQ